MAHRRWAKRGDRQADESLVDPTESVRAEHAQDGDILPERVPPGPTIAGRPCPAAGGGEGTYLIHGTQPDCGGLAVSHGCIPHVSGRYRKALFQQVEVGTRCASSTSCQGRLVEANAARSASPVEREDRATSRTSTSSPTCCAKRGDTTVAIHYYARDVLARADGVLATVAWRRTCRRWPRRIAGGAGRDTGGNAAIPRTARAAAAPPRLNLFTAVIAPGKPPAPVVLAPAFRDAREITVRHVDVRELDPPAAFSARG